ncbi:MAG: hypothetical protein FD175_789 [Beijerinckiaceae bacterium]|nr:MAG: hypothetical protein FD175_789 [Beijerinckiaceae bacterium]
MSLPTNPAQLEAAAEAARTALEEEKKKQTEPGSLIGDAADIAGNVMVDGVGEVIGGAANAVISGVGAVASGAAEVAGTVATGAVEVVGAIIGGIFDS